MSERRLGGCANQDPELLLELPGESGRRGLIRFDVATWKVPDIWIPASAGGSIAEEHLASLDEEPGHDVMEISVLAMTHGCQCRPSRRPNRADGGTPTSSTRSICSSRFLEQVDETTEAVLAALDVTPQEVVHRVDVLLAERTLRFGDP